MRRYRCVRLIEIRLINRNCIFLFNISNKNIESKSFVQVDKINIHDKPRIYEKYGHILLTIYYPKIYLGIY